MGQAASDGHGGLTSNPYSCEASLTYVVVSRTGRRDIFKGAKGKGERSFSAHYALSSSPKFIINHNNLERKEVEEGLS